MNLSALIQTVKYFIRNNEFINNNYKIVVGLGSVKLFDHFLISRLARGSVDWFKRAGNQISETKLG